MGHPYSLGKIYIRRLRRGSLHIYHTANVVVIFNLWALISYLYLIAVVRLVLLRDG